MPLDSLQRQLLDLLAGVHSLREYAGRETWLIRNLSQPVRDQIVPRDNNVRRDLTFIIEAVRGLQLLDGRWAILILLDDLQNELQDTTLSNDINRVRNEIAQILERPPGEPRAPTPAPPQPELTSSGESKRAEWLRILGFKRDPFRYTNGGEDPYLQEYFYNGMRHFYYVFDIFRPETVFVFGPPGSGKSSMRNVISQLCRTENIFPVVYQDFGSMVHKCQGGEVVQAEDHATQILKRALETLARLADEKVISLPTEINDRGRIIRNQLGLYVSEYEDDPLRKQTLENFLKPAQDATLRLSDDARERLGRFCRYVSELFGYQVVYILVDHEDDIDPDEEVPWQVLEPLLSARRLLEIPRGKVSFKFFLSQTFRDRVRKVSWIEKIWDMRFYDLEWTDTELRELLEVRLKMCSEGRFVSLGQLSEVEDLDDKVIDLSRESPRRLIVICNRLFSEHSRGWLSDGKKNLLITVEEVSKILESVKQDYPKSPQEQRLEQWLGQGESDKIEFKSTMRFNLREGKRDKEMDKEVARTICAFMNSEGGALIIGVGDDGKVLGLGNDFSTLTKRQNKDGFELAFVNITEHLFDAPILSNYYEAYFIKYHEKLVYVVEVKSSNKPVFCKFDDTREFYIRKQGTTRKLDSKDMWEYGLERFNYKQVDPHS